LSSRPVRRDSTFAPSRRRPPRPWTPARVTSRARRRCRGRRSSTLRWRTA
jgi:hypothetical protein